MGGEAADSASLADLATRGEKMKKKKNCNRYRYRQLSRVITVRPCDGTGTHTVKTFFSFFVSSFSYSFALPVPVDEPVYN
jgi:hypothetical protein